MSKPQGQGVVIIGANGKVIDTDNKLPVEAGIAFSGDIQLGAVEMKDGVTNDRARVKPANTMVSGDEALATVDVNLRDVNDLIRTAAQSLDTKDGTTGAAADVDGTRAAQLRYIGENIGGGMPKAEYTSPSDFTATYTSTTTITLSSLPFTISDSSQIAYIKYIPTAGSGSDVLVNGQSGVTITVSSNVITVNGASTPFASGDVYEIGINSQDKAYDSSTQSNKISNLNPVYARYTDVETLVSSAQILQSGDFQDLGSEISCQGQNTIGVWLTIDINGAQNVRVRALAKHTSAGSEEYKLPIRTVSASNVKVEDEYIEFNDDVDQLMLLGFDTDNIIPYVQLQVMAAYSGSPGGEIDKAYITKGYK